MLLMITLSSYFLLFLALNSNSIFGSDKIFSLTRFFFVVLYSSKDTRNTLYIFYLVGSSSF